MPSSRIAVVDTAACPRAGHFTAFIRNVRPPRAALVNNPDQHPRIRSRLWHNAPDSMRWMVAIFLSMPLAAACGAPPAQVRPVIRVANNTSMGGALVREYADIIPTIDFQLVDVVGSVNAIDAIQRREADIGIAFADVAYEAQARLAEHPDPAISALRGMAALQVAPVHLVARPGTHVASVGDLRGHRVGTGEQSSGQERLADLIFHAYASEADLERVSVVPAAAASSLEEGIVDAAFLTGYYPLEPVRIALQRGAHLIPIDDPRAERLTQDYPFLRRVTIPANTYPGQPNPIRTIAVDRVLVCHSDLDDALVYALMRRLFDTLPRMPSFLRTSLRLMDVAEASATPIPLHNGAARYYRERELMR